MEVMPTIDKNELAKLFGSDDFGNVSRSTCTKIEKLEAVFDELIDPSLYYRNMRIATTEKGAVLLKGGTKFKSPKLSKTLKDCDEIVCYIATLGDGIEGEIQRLTDKNRLSEAYILDAMASVAADNMVETFHKRMKNKYENQSKQVTLCFSPGYCDWPVTEQKKFFKLVDSEPIGVELNDACLMTPRKSISGIFGIYGDDEIGVDPYIPCSDCRKTDCPERRDF